jgi:hypothetical protein
MKKKICIEIIEVLLRLNQNKKIQFFIHINIDLYIYLLINDLNDLF